MRKLHSIDQIALDYVHCPRCGAVPGDWCSTKSGARASYMRRC